MAEILAHLAAALADHYVLERELGQGGMARVYLAEDLKHGRRVAVKVLRPELAAVVGAERFLAEIRTTAILQHPRILPLFDSGTVRLPVERDGTAAELPYYVMPYVAGETLRARLTRERQLPVADAIAIAAQVAAALHHAHGQGIVHRDIKPENILLQDGEAVVADFGVALALETSAGTRLTETGLTVGTPQYMSPEQALGDRVLDGRSDLYALGCVLYEMLAGEPPHTGATAQVIAAKRLTHPPPPVRAVRETVPPAVEAALARVLAKAPADRFATGRELAAALGGTVEATPPGVRVPAGAGRGMKLAGLLGLGLLVAAGVVLARGRGAGAPVLDEQLLAVAPFDVAGAGLEVWREGVVDLLARSLDGAGSLRTVSPSVVLRGWEGRSDRTSALALGRRTGAGVVATGSLTQLAPGRVRLRATLLDARADEALGEVEVDGATDALGALADSLGLGMLRTLSRTRPVAAVRQASITVTPLGALKAYLAGEQAYRRGSYDSALAADQEALAQDSGFTLAMYRMGKVLGWSPPSMRLYAPADSFLVRAFDRNRRLPARESLLIAADSAAFFSSTAHPELDTLALARLQEAARRFPGDPEVWYALGEHYYPHGTSFRRSASPSAAFESFERALALDPGFAPAYEHVLSLALGLGREDRALAHARAAADLRSSAEFSASVRLASRLLILPESQRPEALAAELDTANPQTLYDVGVGAYLGLPDTNETAVQLLRRLAARRIEPGSTVPWVVDPRMRRRYLAVALTHRGHLQEAVQVAHDDLTVEHADVWWFAWQDPFQDLVMLHALPAEAVARVYAEGLEAGTPLGSAIQRKWGGAWWWAERHDTASLALFERRMAEALRREGRAGSHLAAQYLAGTAGAYLALARGDTAAALTRFEALPDTLYCVGIVSCRAAKYTEGLLRSARGEHARAMALLEEVGGALGVLASLERARIGERTGDRVLARRLYGHVAAMWRTADPELQGYVAQARAGLARVGSP